MFCRVVSEKLAFDWLRQERGDLELFLYEPLPWERSLLWVGRVDGRRELLEFFRSYMADDLEGCCWHAGHEQTFKIGLRLGDFNCGRKFISLRELHPEYHRRTSVPQKSCK